MATISNTPRPGYVWDSTDNVWYPIGVGAHQHTNAADTPAVMPYSTYAAAGKNKIINGDFGIWQRGTSFSPGGYNADRWRYDDTGGATATISRQTFTPGTAPVTGYEGKFFYRTAVTTAAAYQAFQQYIEDVQTFASQTVTLSFWVKAAASTTISAYLDQNFGSGGSSQVGTTISTTIPATTSWTRVNYTVAVPSISGKTIGTGSSLSVRIVIGQGTFDFWGFQLEAGSTATAFQTATGNPASELAACQRYYFRNNALTAFATLIPSGLVTSATNYYGTINFPVQMRTSPTSVDFANLQLLDSSIGTITITGLTTSQASNLTASFDCVITGGTAGRFGWLRASSTTAAYIGLSAEL